MMDEFEFCGEWEQWKTGRNDVYLEGYFSPPEPDMEQAGTLRYLPCLLPERGRYMTEFYLNITISSEPNEVNESIGSDISVYEFESEYIEKNKSIDINFLENYNDKHAGGLTAYSDFLPDWLEDGDQCFVTIRLEYPYEEKVEEYSEGELQEFRERFQEELDEFREIYL